MISAAVLWPPLDAGALLCHAPLLTPRTMSFLFFDRTQPDKHVFELSGPLLLQVYCSLANYQGY